MILTTTDVVVFGVSLVGYFILLFIWLCVDELKGGK